MAWKVSCVMDERVKFVAEALAGERNMRAATWLLPSDEVDLRVALMPSGILRRGPRLCRCLAAAVGSSL